uniref:Expressed protein n=1 Tax=Oryza sativa subsp. japonica TaxID=39947 RepID=Q2QYP8_ORYSJ|nr:expressed protein [Oryza sativa Japonica Group]
MEGEDDGEGRATIAAGKVAPMAQRWMPCSRKGRRRGGRKRVVYRGWGVIAWGGHPPISRPPKCTGAAAGGDERPEQAGERATTSGVEWGGGGGADEAGRSRASRRHAEQEHVAVLDVVEDPLPFPHLDAERAVAPHPGDRPAVHTGEVGEQRGGAAGGEAADWLRAEARRVRAPAGVLVDVVVGHPDGAAVGGVGAGHRDGVQDVVDGDAAVVAGDDVADVVAAPVGELAMAG